VRLLTFSPLGRSWRRSASRRATRHRGGWSRLPPSSPACTRPIL